MDNGSTGKTKAAIREKLRGQPGDNRVVDCPGLTITQMWNRAWLAALDEADQVDLVVLNNDIAVPPGFIVNLTSMLRSDERYWAVYPDYNRRVEQGTAIKGLTPTNGTFRHGGMCGWAWALKAEAHREGLPLMDEQFQWWASDDDLVFAIEASGHLVGRVDGLPVDHVGSVTFNGRGDLHGQGWDDLRRCVAKWGR